MLCYLIELRLNVSLFLLQLQMIASLKIEKEDLESSLCDIQQLQGQMENNKTQLEAERQELLLKKESLTGL